MKQKAMKRSDKPALHFLTEKEIENIAGGVFGFGALFAKAGAQKPKLEIGEGELLNGLKLEIGEGELLNGLKLEIGEGTLL